MSFGLSHQRFPDDTKPPEICSDFGPMGGETGGVTEEEQNGRRERPF